LQRFGFHRSPSIVVLTFNAPLESSSAQNVGNYTILGPNGLTIPVTSALYDSQSNTVTLHPSLRLNIFRAYSLLVNGATANGVRGADGALLDGAGNGTPGTDYRAIIDIRSLVLGLTPLTRTAHPHGPFAVRPNMRIARAPRH